jgi:sugar lactone lactonase YvrE
MSGGATRREFLALGAALAVAPSVRAQTVARRVRTVVGTGVAGAVADGAPADAAQINNPYGVVVGPDGGVYWCDLGSSRILKLDLDTRRVTVVAGNGTKSYSGDGGPATMASISAPHEVRFDSRGDLYFVERDSHVVRRVDMRSGVISTVAGSGRPGYGGDGGKAQRALLAQPHSIAFDAADNLYICDILNNRVRRVAPDSGVITTFAGTGEKGPAPDSGELPSTTLTGPRSMDIAPDGVMYLILREGNAVYRVDIEANRLERIAGTGELKYSGDGGPAINATFGRPGHPLNGPKGVGYAADRSLYIVDTENHAIRRIDLETGTITTVVGDGERADGPDGDPLQCRLNRPHGVFVAGDVVYIGDSENHRIRVLEPA